MCEFKKQLVLVCGVPASGKTYLAKRIAKKHHNCVYLDKDSVIALSNVIFKFANEEINRRSELFNKHIRNPEYDVTDLLAVQALEYNDFVVVNAPYTSELRCEMKEKCERFTSLKEKLKESDAELVIIWIDIERDLLIKNMNERLFGAHPDKAAIERDASIANKIVEEANRVDLTVPTPGPDSNIDRLIVFEAKYRNDNKYFKKFYKKI